MRSRTTERSGTASIACPKRCRSRQPKPSASGARTPSLAFKSTEPIYSVRISRGYRALGLRDGDLVTWFWIGSHADYDKLLV